MLRVEKSKTKTSKNMSIATDVLVTWTSFLGRLGVGHGKTWAAYSAALRYFMEKVDEPQQRLAIKAELMAEANALLDDELGIPTPPIPSGSSSPDADEVLATPTLPKGKKKRGGM